MSWSASGLSGISGATSSASNRKLLADRAKYTALLDCLMPNPPMAVEAAFLLIEAVQWMAFPFVASIPWTSPLQCVFLMSHIPVWDPTGKCIPYHDTVLMVIQLRYFSPWAAAGACAGARGRGAGMGRDMGTSIGRGMEGAMAFASALALGLRWVGVGGRLPPPPHTTQYLTVLHIRIPDHWWTPCPSSGPHQTTPHHSPAGTTRCHPLSLPVFISQCPQHHCNGRATEWCSLPLPCKSNALVRAPAGAASTTFGTRF